MKDTNFKNVEKYTGHPCRTVPNGFAWRLGEGEFGSSLMAWAEKAECGGCEKTRLCLHTDSSGNEYGAVILCLRCIVTIMDYEEHGNKGVGEETYLGVET